MANNANMFTSHPEYANCVNSFTFPEDYVTEAKKLAEEQTPVLDLTTDDVSNKMTAALAQETFAKAIVPTPRKPLFEKQPLSKEELDKVAAQIATAFEATKNRSTKTIMNVQV